ncbi:MAG TPA: AAA family ATPase [Geobacteraceae bacterium]|nr:AAA family ATPase [Geobacteraceae bacterium]
MKCPECGFDNADGINFCGRCGGRLRGPCPSCGAEGQPVWLPCAVCGRVQKEPAVTAEQEKKPAGTPQFNDISIIKRFLTPQLSNKILAARGRIEGERRQVTALFADIKDYTPLSEALGEEATFKVMGRIYEFMITCVLEEEGSVQELTGDGIFALFGAPIALEDAPLRACRAALAIQKKMKYVGDGLIAEYCIRPLARIGINTGPVIVGTVGTDMRMEFKAVGDTVNLASRLESIAEPGGIMISETTYGIVGPFINASFAGERLIKGKSESQKVYRLKGINEHAVRFDASVARGLTPLAGRAEELDLLEHYYEKAAQNNILLVLVIGEAGVGKSRLVHELKRRIESRRDLFLQSNFTSHGRSISMMPFVQLVRNRFRVNDGDDRTVVERKIGQGLELFGIDPDAATPYLMAMLGFEETGNSLKGLDAKIIGGRTRGILISLLRNLCRFRPVVLAVEDLHWIDQASENLLYEIIREEEQMPLLVICTARPSYKSPWTNVANVRELRLAPLSRQSTIDMARSILGCNTLDKDLSRIIIEETGCNPLYTEEMTRYFLESGAIKRSGRTAVCGFAAGEAKVPSTILDLFQSRVDRLEEGPKAVLQIAAVIGHQFSPELARQVSGLGDSFDRHFCELEKLGLIFREDREEQILYRFKHALLQDAVYDSLLKERKESLHQLVAETMERLYSDRLKKWANTLAYHWGKTQNTRKAVQYMAMAGEKSYWDYAMEDAHQRFRKAVELIEAAPGCVDDLLLAGILVKWARVFVYRADFKGMTSLLEHYLPRMEALADKRRLSLILTWLADAHVFAGRGDKAKPLVKRAFTLAEESGDPECIGQAARVLAWLYSYWMPDSGQSDAMVERYCDLALKCAETTNSFIIRMQATVIKVEHSCQRGRFDESRLYCNKLIELGHELRDKRLLSHGQWALGFLHLYEGRYEEALENAEFSLQLSPDLLDELCAFAAKGSALAWSGNASEGLEIMGRVRRVILKNEFMLLLAGVDMSLGAVMVMAGNMGKGVRHIKDAIRHWASLGNYTQPVYGHLLLGDIYLGIATRTTKTTPVIILKNLWFILRTLPVAGRKARRHFEEVERTARTCNMPGFLAKAIYCQGLLSQAKKKHEEARTLFGEALQVAEASNLYISEKIRSVLNSLGKNKT